MSGKGESHLRSHLRTKPRAEESKLLEEVLSERCSKKSAFLGGGRAAPRPRRVLPWQTPATQLKGTAGLTHTGGSRSSSDSDGSLADMATLDLEEALLLPVRNAAWFPP
jgi:hypothetical protein